MFLGESTHTLDAKSRVFVPKRFQKVLAAGQLPDEQVVEAGGKAKGLPLVLTRGTDGCIFLFTESGFREASERMNLAAFQNPELRKAQRLFFSKADMLHLDGSGRVLLSEKLRNFAGIGKEVAMVGVADRAEIWSLAAWEAFNTENEREFDMLAVQLAASVGRSEAQGGSGGPP